MAQKEPVKAPKKFPTGTVKLQIAGNLVFPKKPDSMYLGLFQRFEAIFEYLANLEKSERLVVYKFFNALMLSSHAKKTDAIEEKRRLFNLKNEIFLNLASSLDLRRALDFRYLLANKTRVLKYCESCEAQGVESKLKVHEWKFCHKCQVDKDFFNILSMQFNFKDGLFRIFLSNEHIYKIHDFRKPRIGKLNQVAEEGVFKKFRYNARNLTAIDLSSVLAMNEHILKWKI